EAQFYYVCLHSAPTLLYHMGKKWSPPRRPEAQCCYKELCKVFHHLIMKVWNNDMGWRVVEVMDTHKVCFTTIDIIHFKTAKKLVVGPVTIWIGVFPELTSATAAHDAAQGVLSLLRDYKITDINVDFQESI
ncbi:hypothetical protein EDC04DRAFT_2508632, partial [Pisolithus marmoratus]